MALKNRTKKKNNLPGVLILTPWQIIPLKVTFEKYFIVERCNVSLTYLQEAVLSMTTLSTYRSL